MRPLFIALIIILAALQYKLWLGDGNIFQSMSLDQKLAAYESENNKLAAKNRAIAAEIYELKHGEKALEAQARHELGMIKKGESYYQFIE